LFDHFLQELRRAALAFTILWPGLVLKLFDLLILADCQLQGAALKFDLEEAVAWDTDSHFLLDRV
jgi:hypothetical protein